MIYSISGNIISLEGNKVVIEQQGIAFELLSPTTRTLSIAQKATLYTYLHWSAEQGPSLFGFSSILEKEVFLLIISCSGIGPKLGITILEALSPQDFLQSICQEDVKALSTVKGLGLKKAEQLIVQLKDKALKVINKNPSAVQENSSLGAWIDLQQTLSSLNYVPAEIKQVTATLKHQMDNDQVPFDVLLRKALMLLAKK